MPLLEEPEYFRLHVDGEKVIDVELDIGYNHRGIEKLCEEKTYDQVAFVIERICGICSTSHPIAYVQAVEDVSEIPVPPRALYIRTVIAELERLHSHLLWLGLAGHFIGYNTVFMWAWKYREAICDILERVTGNRQSYAMLKVGGVRRDITDEERENILKEMDVLIPKLDMFLGAVSDDPVLHARLKGVGVLPKQDAIDYCALGPTGRASGLNIDVRKDEPYAAYDKLDWDIAVVEEGDVFAKAAVRLIEMFESVKMIKQAMLEMPEGDVDSNPTDVPPGEGISYGHRFVTSRKSRVAALPVGYADGYYRLLSNRGEVLIRGRRAPVVGTVCMDWILVDVTDLPDVQVSDQVTLLGQDGNEIVTAEEWADKVGSITYEVFCNISKRVPRVYL